MVNDTRLWVAPGTPSCTHDQFGMRPRLLNDPRLVEHQELPYAMDQKSVAGPTIGSQCRREKQGNKKPLTIIGWTTGYVTQRPFGWYHWSHRIDFSRTPGVRILDHQCVLGSRLGMTLYSPVGFIRISRLIILIHMHRRMIPDGLRIPSSWLVTLLMIMAPGIGHSSVTISGYNNPCKTWHAENHQFQGLTSDESLFLTAAIINA